MTIPAQALMDLVIVSMTVADSSKCLTANWTNSFRGCVGIGSMLNRNFRRCGALTLWGYLGEKWYMFSSSLGIIVKFFRLINDRWNCPWLILISSFASKMSRRLYTVDNPSRPNVVADSRRRGGAWRVLRPKILRPVPNQLMEEQSTVL